MTEHHTTQPARVFKMGTTRIVEDASMSSLDNNAIRDLLKTSYPEIANATHSVYFHSFERLCIPQK